jgi:serine phosphatase RsbU (regulator of sigma subunit)
MTKQFAIFLVLFSLVEVVFAQKSKIDSLERLLLLAQPDTQRVNLLNQLSFVLYSKNPEKSKDYADEALFLSEKLNFKRGTAECNKNIGLYFRQKGDFVQALRYLSTGLEIFTQLNDLEGLGSTYITLGLVNGQQGNYVEAMNFHIKSLKIHEKLKLEERIAVSLSNIALTYYLEDDLDDALTYYFKALGISKKVNDKWRIELIYTNIGAAYLKQKHYDRALDYFFQSVLLADSLELPTGRTLLYIGQTYAAQQQYEQANAYLFKSIEAFERSKNKYQIAESANAIGDIHLAQGDTKNALKFYQKAQQYALETGAKAFLSESYKGMAKVHELENDLTKAYYFQQQYTALRDSIYSAEVIRKNIFAKSAYELESKQMQINALQEQHKTDVLLRNIIIGGLCLLCVIGVVSYLNYKKIRKFNALLQTQHNEITKQKEAILLQNKDLQVQKTEILAQKTLISAQHDELQERNFKFSQSISAALQIQQAILPSKNRANRLLHHHFIIYKAKDIVSGDFYWFNETADKKLVIAVMDCTGHGVPAAFITMIVNGLLDRFVIFSKFETPADLLENLNKAMQRMLRQEETGDDSGVDAAVVMLEQAAAHQKKLTFAGAKNDVWLFDKAKQQMQILVADRRSIGGLQSKKITAFTNQVLYVVADSWLYMGSDGFIDQNDIQRTRFGKKRLLALLENLAKQDVEVYEQQWILLNEYNKHAKDTMQRDDILMLGLKI